MNRIYPNLLAARDAIDEYAVRLQALQTELGVWEENDDSCSETRSYAKYYAEDGVTVKTLCN